MMYMVMLGSRQFQRQSSRISSKCHLVSVPDQGINTLTGTNIYISTFRYQR